MRRIKAFLILILFCSSTVSSFASVHACKGEITDIDIIGLASCEHVEKVESHCAHNCCESPEKSSDEDEDDCCTTSELAPNHPDLGVSQNTGLIDVFTITVLFSNFSFLYQEIITDFVEIPIQNPKDKPNLLIKIQCFRI